MATEAAEAPTVVNRDASCTYDAFLSYSHRDEPVAAAIQKGLHRIGRRLGQLHALRVFRDNTDLAANPNLWAKVAEAMQQSRYLIVVLSRGAAESAWVDKEVAHWLERRGPDHLFIVLAEGSLVWNDDENRFDPDVSDAALPVLCEAGRLPAEPLYVDVSRDAPWDLKAAPFRDKITNLAAPIHGKTKYELASDDVREQRKSRRFRVAAITGLALLTITALVLTALVIHAKQLEKYAVAGRLASQAALTLSGVPGGRDVVALQQLLAAHRIAPDIDPGVLYTGVAGRRNLLKVVITPGRNFSFALRPDGRQMASGDEDGAIRIWDTDTGEAIGGPMQPEGADRDVIVGVSFSPDGHRIASGSGNSVHVWNADTHQDMGELGRHDDAVESVAFSPDGHIVASAGDDGAIRLWDTNTRDRQIFQVNKNPVNWIAFDSTGDRIASGGADQTVRVWDVRKRQIIGTLDLKEDHDSTIFAVAISPDGHRIVSAGDDPRVRLWNVDTGRQIGEPMTGHFDTIRALAFSADGTRVASGSDDGTVRLWDAVIGGQVGDPIGGSEGPVNGVAFSADGKRVFTDSSDKTIRVRDIASYQPMSGHSKRVESVAYGHNVIVSGSLDGTVRKWDPSTGESSILTTQPGTVHAVALSPDGHSVASASADYDDSLQLRNLDSGAVINDHFQDHTGPIEGIAFSPDGDRLASVGGGSVQLWNPRTGQLIAAPATLSGANFSYLSVAFSPDGRFIATGDSTGAIQIRDGRSAEVIGAPLEGNSYKVVSVAFSPDSRQIASGNADTTVRRWDVDSHRELGSPMKGHADWVMSVAYSQDGSRIVSGSDDGTIRLWDARSGHPLGLQIPAHTGGVMSVAFSPDNRRIVSGGYDRNLRLWPTPEENTWADVLCQKLTTNMSVKDWQKWVSSEIDYMEICPGLPISSDAVG